MNEKQLLEYQEMKLNYDKFKEDSYFYKGAMDKSIKAFLKSIPKYILVPILEDLGVVKRKYTTNKVELKESDSNESQSRTPSEVRQ
jgi:hypothetical protein